MPTELVIRPAHEDDLAAVLQLWIEAEVPPASVSDSMEGLTRLVREPNAALIIAIIDRRLVGSVIGGWDGWRSRNTGACSKSSSTFPNPARLSTRSKNRNPKPSIAERCPLRARLKMDSTVKSE